MQPIQTKRALCAAALATLLAAPAAARAPDCAAVNLRDYWILAEIRNPATGESASFRIDCSGQSPLGCKGAYPKRWLVDAYIHRRDAQSAGRPDNEPWPEFLQVEVVPMFSNILGYAGYGAGGFATANQKNLVTPLPKPAPLSELRTAAGFSIGMSTVRGGEKVDDSDVRLTMWLVTPEELTAREAAGAPAGAAEAKPKPAKPALGRAPRR